MEDRDRITRRRLVAGAALALALAGAGLLGTSAAAEDCARVPVATTGFDDVVACWGEGDSADGTVAVSLRGPARASGELPAAAVSGTGRADRSIVCASGTGRAGGPHDPDLGQECTASAGGTGDASGWALAASGGGTAQAPVAVSLFGDSHAQLVSVSGTGRAGGDTYTGRHEAPFIAISGCEAEHATHDDDDNLQVLTADPGRVHVLVDVDAALQEKDPEQWEATDVQIPVGGTVQDVTCGTSP